MAVLVATLPVACGHDDSGAPVPFTTRVSVATGGTEAVGGPSGVPAASADGRYIAFASDAANLVPADGNGTTDVFVYDSATGQTTRVSVSSAGSEATGGGSRNPSMSADGRYVAFESDATNLVDADTNTVTDIFLHDRTSGETTRMSVDNSGNQATGVASFGPAVSADGQHVAYVSGASNLVLGDTNNLPDIFIRDRVANITSRVSVSTGGTQGTGPAGSTNPSLSADGQFVAFASAMNDLVGDDTNNEYDVFVHDRLSGATTRVSVTSTGGQAIGGASDSPSISGDGSIVAFRSSATNLVTGDTNGADDIFLRDLIGGATIRASVDSDGAQVLGPSAMRNGGLSSDGSVVVFESSATNLVADDTNGVRDVFAHDRTTGRTTRQSVTSGGTQATGGASADAVISGNGTVVSFDSFASDLVPADTNGQLDVFRASRR
ncbi:hypothetical protein YTPLAS18_09560 [Nitrospira sp.]|nr:hypothetical protein YTPLAS18_09560 [Nitrospira sp.]